MYLFLKGDIVIWKDPTKIPNGWSGARFVVLHSYAADEGDPGSSTVRVRLEHDKTSLGASFTVFPEDLSLVKPAPKEPILLTLHARDVAAGDSHAHLSE